MVADYGTECEVRKPVIPSTSQSKLSLKLPRWATAKLEYSEWVLIGKERSRNAGNYKQT